jgi:hypothetical protein
MTTAPRSVSLPIFVFGYIAIGSGLSSYAHYYYELFALGYPKNMGIVLGSYAFVVLGLLAIAIGAALRKLERRLRALEDEPSGE